MPPAESPQGPVGLQTFAKSYRFRWDKRHQHTAGAWPLSELDRQALLAQSLQAAGRIGSSKMPQEQRDL